MSSQKHPRIFEYEMTMDVAKTNVQRQSQSMNHRR
jgi:hypothetical protein